MKQVKCIRVKRETIENLRELYKNFGETALYQLFDDICAAFDPNYPFDKSTMLEMTEEKWNDIKKTKDL